MAPLVHNTKAEQADVSPKTENLVLQVAESGFSESKDWL
jgi:hypothetical protein